MNIRARVVAASVAALALTGGGVGATVAASASASTAPPHAVVSEPTSPDHDAVQQGDQTTPDRTTAAATSGENGSGHNRENAPSDGPGGWADASRSAQHQFNGVE
jgi:hypothetical protein